jgi:hypothetical protein
VAEHAQRAGSQIGSQNEHPQAMSEMNKGHARGPNRDKYCLLLYPRAHSLVNSAPGGRPADYL